MKGKSKQQKGITLIALIITIVVLLILAAVAISSITNDGILGYAQNAAKDYNQAVKNEQSMLQEYEDYLKGANGGFEAYEVGDEVTIGSETFYVIKDSPKTESKLVLLAKYNIIADKTNANYLTQSSNAGNVAFSETYYWFYWDTELDRDVVYPEYEQKENLREQIYYDLTETGVPDSTHTAAYAAYQYGAQFEGAIGRLMTPSEADTLSKNTTFSSKLFETWFWLSGATNPPDVWVVAFDNVSGNTENIGGPYGVRPVIEISKSKVTAVTE